jgi:hypothetical protein
MKTSDHSEDLAVDDNIKTDPMEIRWCRWDFVAWDKNRWLYIVRKQHFRFYEKQGIYWTSERPPASRDLCSVEAATYGPI